jgi:hypothetical protein
MFRNKASFCCEEWSASRATPKLEDCPLGVRDCSFNIFAATLHVRGRFSSCNLRTPYAVVNGTHLWRCENFNRPESGAVGNVLSLFHCCRQLSDMYPRNIASDILNFSRHLINYCLLSVFFADPSRFSAENGSSSKNWLGIYPVCKGYVLFSFEIFWLWENHGKGRKNGNSSRIVGHSISVCDNFSNSTNCKDRRKYSVRFTRETMTRTVESVGGGRSIYYLRALGMPIDPITRPDS